MRLGQSLANARKKAELSQSDVSRHMGYTTCQFISNWERDVSFPPIGDLKKLAKLYGIDANYLFECVSDAKIKLEREKMKGEFNGSV